MSPSSDSRRSFLRAAAGAAAAAALGEASAAPRAGGGADLLIAYVGTYSSPLHDVLPTQVDLPPGNGRGIHLFQVDRGTGALRPAGVQELGTSPSAVALN